MPINPKVFVGVSALGGGCAGLALYFWQSSNSSKVTAQQSAPKIIPVAQSPSSNSNQEPKSVASGSCEIVDFSEEIKGFLKEQKQDKEDYVAFSCENNRVQDDYAPLPSGWKGWFPKLVFSGDFWTTKNKFEVNTETYQEDSNWGSITKISFSGSGLTNTFKGTIDKVEAKNLKESVDKVNMWGGDKSNILVYLFLPTPEVTSDSD